MKQSIVLAGGCFWCLEAAYQLIKGVIMAEPGYCGGKAEEADYETVCSGRTNHAESVRISYDPETISLDDILEIFWTIHDPTTLNRQGNDVGRQYRSAIFYDTEEQKKTAEKSLKSHQKYWQDKIVTEITPLSEFYPAEAYHRNYFMNNPDKSYCQLIINPKLTKLRRKLSDKIK